MRSQGRSFPCERIERESTKAPENFYFSISICRSGVSLDSQSVESLIMIVQVVISFEGLIFKRNRFDERVFLMQASIESIEDNKERF